MTKRRSTTDPQPKPGPVQVTALAECASRVYHLAQEYEAGRITWFDLMEAIIELVCAIEACTTTP